ncbi:MAG: PQQ-binding-like beta-propeller repeat protein [candidate division WOR-3 bacterium]|nr:MAG: PQQ-binding-like beta-propeller repeat protein [candidate division WOR-3 bacterium]
MRRSLALALAAVAVVVFTTGCPNKAPKVPVRPIGPDSVPADTTAAYRTVTDDPNKDQILYVFDWDDGTYDTTDYGSSGDTVEASHSWFMMKPYGVRVRAKDDVGNWSAWSDTHLVIVGDTINRPPRPSTPWGPDVGVINTEYTFYAYARDANGDSFRIKFTWGNGDTSAWSDWLPSGDTFSANVTYIDPGIMFIRAVAWDPHGASATSDSFMFRVTTGQPNEAPLKPIIEGPVKGIANGPAYRFWASASDPDGQPVRYIFNWGDGSVDTTEFGVPVGDTATHVFATDGDYQITVIAQDDSMAVSETSDPHEFKTVGEGEIIWYHRIDDAVTSSPALAVVTSLQHSYPTPSIVVGVQDGSLLALEAYNCMDTSGVVAYREYPTEAEDFFSSPAASTDGWVYIGNSNGYVYAFDDTGTVKWSWTDPNYPLAEFDASPILDGEFIYAAGSAGKLYKLTYDGTEADTVWGYAAEDEIQSSPALGPNGNIVLCDDSGYVHSVDADGARNWTPYNVGENITCSPAVGADGTVYFGTEQGKMYAVNSSGALAWQYEIMEANVGVMASPVIDADGNVYFAADNGTVYKFSANGDSLKATAITRSSITATPALSATGILYVAAEDDTLYWVDISDLNVTRTVELKIPTAYRSRGGRPRSTAVDDLWPSPVIDMYGIVYAVGDEGDVFAVAGSGALAPTAWPMFRHDVRHTGKSGSW